ncbi:WXG100 family type VII secretion target [Streptomyces sp. NPDC054833]
MGEQPKRREPQLARTDFESMTHEQLAALIDSASSSGASHLTGKLAKAASTITKIGDDLMTYVKGLEWQGEAGDAFRDWGGQTAGATLRLGQYAEVASRWMGTVSQAITEAKAAMPDVSETTQAKTDLADAHATIAAAKQPGAHNDPDARKLAQTAKTDATAAQGRIEAARAEAAQQMRKLAQTYEYSAQQVNSVTPPTFSPPAGRAGSDRWWYGGGKEHVSASGTSLGGGTSSSMTRGSGVAATGPGGSRIAASHTVSEQSTSHVATPRIHASEPASLGLDGVDTLPRTPTPSTTAPPMPHTTVPHQDLPVTGQPTTVPPVFGSGGRVPGPASTPRLPSPSQLPQTTGPGGTANGRTPRVPRETGITGGRPVTSDRARPQNGLPRGTVIGKEGVQGRTGMTRGVPPGTGAPGEGPGSAKGLASGRRLASETGGVVGSRPVQQVRGGGRPFTPGGSGLVRPASNAAEGARGAATGRTGTATSSGRTGAVANAGQPSGSRKDQQHGQRPDYLVEDEETWVRDDRRPLPPVVG